MINIKEKLINYSHTIFIIICQYLFSQHDIFSSNEFNYMAIIIISLNILLLIFLLTKKKLLDEKLIKIEWFFIEFIWTVYIIFSFFKPEEVINCDNDMYIPDIILFLTNLLFLFVPTKHKFITKIIHRSIIIQGIILLVLQSSIDYLVSEELFIRVTLAVIFNLVTYQIIFDLTTPLKKMIYSILIFSNFIAMDKIFLILTFFIWFAYVISTFDNILCFSINKTENELPVYISDTKVVENKPGKKIVMKGIDLISSRRKKEVVLIK